MAHSARDPQPESVLPEDVPVTMPDLPPRLIITTVEQFKAMADPTRSRILGIIQNQPATAKQLAQSLGMAPGTIGHHLQVLEAAGLARITARRLVRGIVAKYYTRTARIFNYALPPELAGEYSTCLDIMSHARDELADAELDYGDEDCGYLGFPHARLSPERIAYYQAKVDALINEMVEETPDPTGEVHGLCVAFIHSPKYLQRVAAEEASDAESKPAESSHGGTD